MPAIWAELALVVVLAQLYTASWALLGPQQPFRGSPLFNWYSCQPFQVFVFPVLCTIAWFRWRRTSRLPCKERSVARWLMAPYSDGEVGRPTEHVYFIILIGYFAKDIFIPMDLFFWIHHSICVAGCLYGLVADPPALLMLGSMLLELGSAAQAWHHYTPDSHTIFYGYIFVMTASNLIGVGLALVFAFAGTVPTMSRIVRAFFAGLGILLFIARQQFCLEMWAAFHSN